MPHLSFLPLLRLALAAFIVVWLAGCASVSPPGTPTSQPTAPGQPQEPAASGSAPPPAVSSAVAQPSDTATPLPAAAGEAGSEAVAPPQPPVSGNRAVVALLERARQEAGSGRRESAGASLERALRIEPRNAWLWHELARLRLTQGQYAQAISLSQKSNSLAVRERSLQALNWHLIADARIAQGDPAGAAQARKLAEDLQRP